MFAANIVLITHDQAEPMALSMLFSYPESMFLSIFKKNNVYPSFYYTNVAVGLDSEKRFVSEKMRKDAKRA